MRVALLATIAVSSVAHADPASIARTLVVDQLAALHSPQAFLATLAPNAVILGNGSFAIANSSNAPAVISTMSRGRLTQSFLNQVDAGGSGSALWLSADVIFIDDSGAAGRTHGSSSSQWPTAIDGASLQSRSRRALASQRQATSSTVRTRDR